jgi:signal transduction histidine kinase
MSDLLNLIEQYDGFIHAWEKMDSAKQAHETLHGKVEAIRQLQHELDLDFLKEDSKALIAESLEGGARIRSIVQDLREFSHPSVKTQEGVDFNHCLDTTLSMLSGKIRNGVCIQKDYADLPVVTCYLREMNQVFYNIMLNALQVIGPQGQLILSTRACGDGWVEVGISDTGPGIPARSMARIFEPFYTTRQVGEGIGLGLYLAYNIVKSHNGTIVVESKEGGGSTFRVKIPVEGSKA